MLIAVNVLNGGVNYTSPTVNISGGGGSSAAVTLSVTDGVIESGTVSVAGTGYTSTPTVSISDATGSGGVIELVFSTVASATVNLMPFAIGGTTVEVYAGRVWVGNGAVITFSAPGSFTDFSSANGGGNFTSSDSFLRVRFVSLVQTNGFLYLIANSSVNYISGVQTTGTPPITTFTNQNADPEVGTPYASTTQVFGRNIVFANAFGAHISYGAAVTKISEALDGVYNTVPNNFGNFIPSSAKAILFGKKVWMFLLPIINPISGQQVNQIFIWNGKIWWASQQGVNLNYIQHQEINSILTAYGTDGSSIYPLFDRRQPISPRPRNLNYGPIPAISWRSRRRGCGAGAVLQP